MQITERLSRRKMFIILFPRNRGMAHHAGTPGGGSTRAGQETGCGGAVGRGLCVVSPERNW